MTHACESNFTVCMYILFIYNLLTDVVRNSDYAVSNDKMIVNSEFERLQLEAPC
jgi:hypothetical protein